MTKKRSHSSTQWLQRWQNDPFVQRARKEGWRARSAFKLLEINKKYHLLRKGMTVLDLGAAPGGWSEVLVSLVQEGHIVAIDKLPMDPISGVTVMQQDLEEQDAFVKIMDALKHKAHVVLSDAAPNTIGHPATDHLRMMGLVELIWYNTQQFLHPGGSFVCKGWKGSEWDAFIKSLRSSFLKVAHFKPQSSQKESREVFVVAQGFQPT